MYLGSGVVEVFDPGLGTLQGYEAKIQVDANTQPWFYKARSPPYSMKILVEKEVIVLREEISLAL